MIVYWSNDPDSTRGTYSGQDSALWRQWLKEKGVKMVFIDPFYNYTNAVMEGKWITPRMGTDTAMAMAIAFVWITEDTYDKDYIKDRTVGFEEFKKYILGETDGQPKTPEWAAEECGVEPGSSAPWPGSGRPNARSCPAGPRGGEGGACRTGLRHRVGPHDGAASGHAGPGRSGPSASGAPPWARPSDATLWVPSLRRARMAGYRCPPGGQLHLR